MQSWAFCIKCDDDPADEVEVLLSDSLAQAQVTQVGSLEAVVLPAEEFGFSLLLRLRLQTLSQVGLGTSQLKRRRAL